MGLEMIITLNNPICHRLVQIRCRKEIIMVNYSFLNMETIIPTSEMLESLICLQKMQDNN
jgi:hypothetical protein